MANFWTKAANILVDPWPKENKKKKTSSTRWTPSSISKYQLFYVWNCVRMIHVIGRICDSKYRLGFVSENDETKAITIMWWWVVETLCLHSIQLYIPFGFSLKNQPSENQNINLGKTHSQNMNHIFTCMYSVVKPIKFHYTDLKTYDIR